MFINKRKGFTLIELLTVIVILALIVIIATPLVINEIEIAKIETFKSTAQRIIDTAKLDFAEWAIDEAIPEITFTYQNGKEYSSIPGKNLEYKGTKPKSGTVIINSDGEVAIAIHNGIYCATKGYHNSEITVTKKTLEECSYGPVTFGRIFGGINNDTFNKVIAVSDGFIAVGLSDSFDRDLA